MEHTNKNNSCLTQVLWSNDARLLEYIAEHGSYNPLNLVDTIGMYEKLLIGEENNYYYNLKDKLSEIKSLKTFQSKDIDSATLAQIIASIEEKSIGLLEAAEKLAKADDKHYKALNTIPIMYDVVYDRTTGRFNKQHMLMYTLVSHKGDNNIKLERISNIKAVGLSESLNLEEDMQSGERSTTVIYNPDDGLNKVSFLKRGDKSSDIYYFRVLRPEFSDIAIKVFNYMLLTDRVTEQTMHVLTLPVGSYELQQLITQETKGSEQLSI